MFHLKVLRVVLIRFQSGDSAWCGYDLVSINESTWYDVNMVPSNNTAGCCVMLVWVCGQSGYCAGNLCY